MEGNLINRILENQKQPEITVGMDITQSFYSDRHCYFVTRVINQKHIFVKKYFIAPDWSEPPMSNGWKYFKTAQEYLDYQNNNCPKYKNSEFKLTFSGIMDIEEEWVFRYGKWREVISKKDNRYLKLPSVIFGVRDYYYDYEF